MWGSTFSLVAIVIALVAILGAYYLMKDSMGQLW
jgi:hypothetical protein